MWSSVSFVRESKSGRRAFAEITDDANESENDAMCPSAITPAWLCTCLKHQTTSYKTPLHNLQML
jgi:hypothetical protein